MADYLLSPEVPIITGHSHSTCMGVPLVQKDGVARLVGLSNGDRRFCAFSGAWPRPAPFWEELASVAQGRVVALVWAGNAHNVAFLLSPGRPLDFVLHEVPELPVDPEAVIIPDLAVDALLGRGMNGLENTIKRLQARGAARVIVCGTPAPKASMEILRNGVFKGDVFRRRAEELGLRLEDAPISSPRFRYKAWRVVQRQLIRAARAHSVGFLPVPESSLVDGLLRDEFADATDATHGNSRYGCLMLDHLDAYLKQGAS